MKLEAIGEAFIYRWPTGEVRLVPGHPVELPDGRAVRLLEKAPGRVRVVVESANEVEGDLTGRRVIWDSPLFGLLSATVQEDLPNGVRVLHPLTEVECVIPTTWLCRQYQ
jgi:hypothetical protein